MSLMFNKETELVMMESVINGSASWKVTLVTDDVVVTPATVAEDLTQADYDGYDDLGLINYGCSFNGDGKVHVDLGEAFFQAPSVTNPYTITGYYVSTSAIPGLFGARKIEPPVTIDATHPLRIVADMVCDGFSANDYVEP